MVSRVVATVDVCKKPASVIGKFVLTGSLDGRQLRHSIRGYDAADAHLS